MPYTYHVPCHTPGAPIKVSKNKTLYINARRPGRAGPLWLWLQVSSYLVALDHPGYTARMSLKRPRSLKKLILGHEIAILFLVTVTGLIGGLSAYFWQQNSAESVRINAMFYFTEQIRGELYAQIQTMIRARVLQDPRALETYPQYSRSISERLNELRRRSRSRAEDMAIQALNLSYREIQRAMNNIFTNPNMAIRSAQMQLLDPQFAQYMVGKFEQRYTDFKAVLSAEHAELDRTLALWTRFAPLIIPVPLLIVLLIALYTRYVMQTGFIRPIAGIMQGAGRISQGRLDCHIDEHGVAEVADLAQAINKMAAELASSRSALLEKERQGALGALVPVVAHNIRNPLASIRATAQLLEHADNRAEIDESRRVIIETTDRLGRWVNALVSYLHPLQPKLRQGSAARLVDAALALLEGRIAEKKIEIERQGWTPERPLRVDPDLMEQALYGLLANAVDASPPGARISLTLDATGGNTRIRIQDQGSGLPFEPRPGNLEPGPSTKRFGTGLGLPIAYKICQTHGWDLSFNVQKGAGTEAIITAPGAAGTRGA